MKKTVLVFFVALLHYGYVFSQPLRLHLMGGMANYNGDLQQKIFTFKQARGVVTAGATYDLGSRFSLRGEYSFATLSADDKFNKPGLQIRNLNFKTIIKELNLMGEYNIFDLTQRRLSPYFFTGLSGFYFSPYTYTEAGEKVYLISLSTEGQGLREYPNRYPYKKIQLAIPVGGGIKYALSDDIQLGLELGFRKLFTDYLDDVSTTYVDESTLLLEKGATAAELAFRGDELKTNPQAYPPEGSIRGKKNKDLYYFGQFRISFRMNWFDKDRGGSDRNRRVNCPSKIL